jgi:methionyl-tRNA formyltransferase
MRIGYFGDGRWAHRALEGIIEASELHVAYVVARHENPDPVLRQYAQDIDVPFFTPPNVNESSFLDDLASYSSEVNVSMSYNQILRPDAIHAAPKGFINCHAGALPFYRGRNILNWALINGEERFGVTVHFVDEGIDTGDIITQKFGAITPADDYESLLDKAVDLCADALLDALHDLRQGQVSRTLQDTIHPVGFYCSARGEGDEWIDWSWSTERIHNFVRAIAPPGPGARTVLDGDPVVILSSEKIPQAPTYIDRPGTVVGRAEEGIVVKTGDATLKISRIADWNGEVCNPRTPRLRIGTTFGLNIKHELTRLNDRVDNLERRLADLETE